MLKYNTRMLYLKRRIFNQLDPEMFVLADHLDRRSLFLDIGANRGLYTYHYSSVFNKVVAFEPVEECYASVKRLKLRNAEVHSVALSDERGTATLFSPVRRGDIDFQRSSLLESAVFEVGSVKRQVQTHTLDEFCFSEVDLIKIDTEGAELQVLKGATKTIEKNLPLIFVEMEERHRKNAVRDGITFLKKFGYRCSYFDLKKSAFVSLDISDLADTNLRVVGSKANNYLFHIPGKHLNLD